MFIAGLETESLGQSGTETVWPVLSSPLKNLSALKGEEATSMILELYGEGKKMCTVCLCTSVLHYCLVYCFCPRV